MSSSVDVDSSSAQFDAAQDPLVIAENNRQAFNNRIFVSILLGACAGILGLENLWGALFYLVGSLIGVGLFITLKVGFGKGSLYYSNWTEIFTSSLSTNLFTFVMVWTLFYDIVHVYV